MYSRKFGLRLHGKFGFLTEGNEGREDPFPKLFGFWQTGVREENKRTELGFSRCKRKIRGSIQHRANSNFVFFALASKALPDASTLR
jgi:hypothetical protein